MELSGQFLLNDKDKCAIKGNIWFHHCTLIIVISTPITKEEYIYFNSLNYFGYHHALGSMTNFNTIY